jgi:hypothetical protein
MGNVANMEDTRNIHKFSVAKHEWIRTLGTHRY